MPSKIAIIGSGVIGLMTGIRLLEKGSDVTIFSREFEPNISSRGAPAIWIPYKALPEEKVLQWATYSLDLYKEMLLTKTKEEIGIFPAPLIEYHIQKELPLWTRIQKDFLTLKTDLPANCVVGYSTSTLVIDSQVFVDYLINWYKKLNGKMQFANFTKLEDVDKSFNTIINCSGVWAQQLVNDEEVFPIRGQYILMEKPEGLEQITFVTIDEDSYTLIVPRVHDCYVGGTVNANDWNTQPIEETTQTLLSNATQFVPELENMSIKKVGVGLRPGRTAVRVEKDKTADGRVVIHHYGHGGSGFTIGWGTSLEVLKLI